KRTVVSGATSGGCRPTKKSEATQPASKASDHRNARRWLASICGCALIQGSRRGGARAMVARPMGVDEAWPSTLAPGPHARLETMGYLRSSEAGFDRGEEQPHTGHRPDERTHRVGDPSDAPRLHRHRWVRRRQLLEAL